MSDLRGQVALVTGASRGICRAIAVARDGADVALDFRERSDEAAETDRQVEAFGRRELVVRADVAEVGEVAGMVEEVARGLGLVDILVNNAGQSRPLPLDVVTVADFDDAIAVNLRSAFLATLAILPGMRARHRGRLIYVSSVATQLGGVVGPHFAASSTAVGLCPDRVVPIGSAGLANPEEIS